MNRTVLALALLFSAAGLAAQQAPLIRLQAKVAVVPVADLTLSHLAGKYSDPTKEFSPSLAGNNLYLFPDGEYIYDEWADIQPLTIYDEGRWSVEDGIIVLSSDKEISWDPGEEHKYIAVARRSHRDEILLIGIGKALARFEEAEEASSKETETDFMMFAKDLRMAITRSSAARIKKKLLRTEWKPAYFKAK